MDETLEALQVGDVLDLDNFTSVSTDPGVPLRGYFGGGDFVM